MIGLLNIGSLVLGVIALLLPISSLLNTNKQLRNYRLIISSLSLSACAISISFQLFYNHHLVEIEDWSALMDTTSSSVLAVTFLLISTILLNALTIIINRDKTAL